MVGAGGTMDPRIKSEGDGFLGMRHQGSTVMLGLDPSIHGTVYAT